MQTRLTTTRNAHLAVASVLILVNAAAQQALDRDSYLARIAELQQEGPEIARTQGKEALIADYRTLIDQNPGYANNIQLETQIGLIYESDLSDSGEPPDMDAAYNQYLTTIDSYDVSHPYMKQVRKKAAEQAAQLDPPAAEDLYWGIIEDYPDDADLVTASYYNLAKLAEQNGDAAAAKEYYEQVLNSVPADDSLSEAERATVQQYEANAVLNLIADAIRAAQTPEQRLAALEAFIEQFPDLPYTHGELIDELLRSIETMGDRAESRPELKEAVRTLVRLLQERRAEEESMSEEIRELRREHRRNAAGGGDPGRSVAANMTGEEVTDGETGRQRLASGTRELDSGRNGAPGVTSPGHDAATDASTGRKPWVIPVGFAVIALIVLAVLSKRLR